MVTLIFLYRTSIQLEAFHTNLPSLPATIQLGKPHMPVLMPTNPNLASFVGTDSWKLWELLGVGHAWL